MEPSGGPCVAGVCCCLALAPTFAPTTWLQVLAAFTRPQAAIRWALGVVAACLDAPWPPQLLSHEMGECTDPRVCPELSSCASASSHKAHTGSCCPYLHLLPCLSHHCVLTCLRRRGGGHAHAWGGFCCSGHTHRCRCASGPAGWLRLAPEPELFALLELP